MWCFTFGRFGSGADAVVGAVDLLSLHHNVLQAFVISVEAVLQQLTERDRAAENKNTKISLGLKNVAREEKGEERYFLSLLSGLI